MMIYPTIQFHQLLQDIFPFAKRGFFKLWRAYGRLTDYEEYGSYIAKDDFNTKHEIFQSSADQRRYRHLIVTTKQTVVLRNGPPAEERWYVEYAGATKQEARDYVRAKAGIPHPAFEQSLRNRLSILILDEVQDYESHTTRGGDFVHGLNATFTIGFTGTPLQSGPLAARGLFRFIYEPQFTTLSPPSYTETRYLKCGHASFCHIYTEAGWDEFIKNESPEDQAYQIREALLPVMISGTVLTSATPGSDRAIGQEVPKAVVKSLEIQHSPENQELYDRLAEILMESLYKDSERPRRQVDINFSVLRQLHLLSNMPQPHYCHEKYFAQKMSIYILLRPSNFFNEVFRTIHEKSNGYASLSSSTISVKNGFSIADRIRKDFPKLKLLSADIYEFTLCKNRNTPLEQLIIYQFLRLTGMEPLLYHSSLVKKRRDEILAAMAAKRENTRVLVSTMELLGKAVNLQACGNVMIFMNSPKSEGIRKQCINRLCRLKSPYKTVDVREYHIKGTFYDRVVTARFRKALPNHMLQLDARVIGLEVDDGNDLVVDNWVWIEATKTLYTLDKAEQLGRGNLKTLNVAALLEKILLPLHEKASKFAMDQA